MKSKLVAIILLLVILLLAILLAGSSQGRGESNAALGDRLQKAMDESLKNSGAIGVSAAVMMPDGWLWQGAAGISHEGVPLTTAMLFCIASVQKNLQAALALRLIQEGRLALDDPLDKWLPAYPNIDGKITVRQLLNLTSGIDNFVEDQNSPWRIGYKNIGFEKWWTWEEILAAFIGPANFKPGERCAYSTTNYIVLRLIIEKASRSRQANELRRRLLKPNHLNHTLADFKKPIPKGMVIAHGWCDTDGDGQADDISGHSLNWIASIAPMLVYSTPGDMVRWMNALYHKKTVLNHELLKAMLSFVGPVQNEPLMKGYGLGVVDINLGLMIPKWDGVACHGHLGSEIGYTTFVGYFPDYGVSLAVMFNRGCDRDTDRAVMTVGAAVTDALFKHLGVPESKPKDPVSQKTVSGNIFDSPRRWPIRQRIDRTYADG